MKTLSREKNGNPIQGFAPSKIISISSESVDVSDWLAFCFPESDVIYQINGSGPSVTLPANTIRVLSDNVNTITFSGITTVSCEVM